MLEPWDADQPGTLTLDSEVSYGLATAAVEDIFPPDLLTLLQSAKFSAGILSRPYFSSLGGWGYQKAVYNNGNLTIISDTSMGRTSFYSFEIKGRIAVFWNVAKLVYVYERTVVPRSNSPPRPPPSSWSSSDGRSCAWSRPTSRSSSRSGITPTSGQAQRLGVRAERRVQDQDHPGRSHLAARLDPGLAGPSTPPLVPPLAQPTTPGVDTFPITPVFKVPIWKADAGLRRFIRSRT